MIHNDNHHEGSQCDCDLSFIMTTLGNRLKCENDLIVRNEMLVDTDDHTQNDYYLVL